MMKHSKIEANIPSRSQSCSCGCICRKNKCKSSKDERDNIVQALQVAGHGQNIQCIRMAPKPLWAQEGFPLRTGYQGATRERYSGSGRWKGSTLRLDGRIRKNYSYFSSRRNVYPLRTLQQPSCKKWSYCKIRTTDRKSREHRKVYG